MDVSTIIVSYNTASLLPEAMKCLGLASQGYAMETLFVDNASKDNSVDVIRNQFPDCRLIENTTNVGFGRANNQALPFVTGRYVLLLNTDAFVAPDTLTQTIAYMDVNPKCGILGVRLVGRDGVLQPCCRYFPTPLNTFLHRTGLNRLFKGVQMVDDMTWPHDAVRSCDWVVGCYYLIRKEVIDQVGLFDPRYFLYCEEVDHCFAAKKAGWDVVFYSHTTVVHLGGESAKTVGAVTKSGSQLEAMQIESELLYFRKNHGLPACIMHVMLCFLADALLAAKRLLKGPNRFNLAGDWQHSAAVASLFWQTHAATKPTR